MKELIFERTDRQNRPIVIYVDEKLAVCSKLKMDPPTIKAINSCLKNYVYITFSTLQLLNAGNSISNSLYIFPIYLQLLLIIAKNKALLPDCHQMCRWSIIRTLQFPNK